ncbi:MAG TPA: hypothetical protein ENJ80_01610 [Gammaproteobacteria bacterium]|nr:hypothetical protein [Gammaproteobacteria bacterium]
MTDCLNHFLRALVLGLLLCNTAGAAETATREFEIELVVFQNLINNDGGEIWPVDYSEWFADPYLDEEQDPAAAEAAKPGSITAIDWLPESAYRLVAERNALGRSSQYRPLAYFAWRQSVLDRNQAQPVDLSSETHKKNGAYVDGTVRVAVERYLHLYLDLKLHIPINNEQLELMEYDIPEFRLAEHRRMRSKEIHYFDHPRFGVIALITPYEKPPEPEVSEPAAVPVTTPPATTTP